MENNQNESAPSRHEGNLNDPLVEINLDKFIKQIKAEKTWTDNHHSSMTVFKSETMRIVLIGLHKDAQLKPHKANGVISVQVLEGKVNFITEQHTALIEKGQMIALQANITHGVVALKESFFLLTLAINK